MERDTVELLLRLPVAVLCAVALAWGFIEMWGWFVS